MFQFMNPRILKSALLAFLCVNQSIRLGAQPVPARPASAYWITAATAPHRDESIVDFRKVIALEAPPARFTLHVSADNQFIFYVNGERVGSGPSRSDLAHWRYETYDIARFLRPGKNILAATVWNFGTHAAVAQISDRIAFLVEGDAPLARAADTDASWRVKVEKAIRTIVPEVRGYYAAEPGERFDASLVHASFMNETEEDDNSWTDALPLSRASVRGESDPHSNWQLMADPLPPMEMKLVPAGRVVRTSGIEMPSNFPAGTIAIPAHAKASILIDNSHLTTGYPDLTVADGAGARIRLTYAEALAAANGEKGNRNQIAGKHIAGVFDEFQPSGRPNSEFMPLSWRTWRFLQLDITTADQALRIDKFQTWFTAYPFTEAAHFDSDDPTLASIWQIGWRTARLDAHDTYMDTPYWERLQYVGDTRIQALLSYLVANDDRLARQAIEAFNSSRFPDGLTQSRYPSSLRQIIPTFSLLWIGMVHDFWLYRGDADFVRAQLPGIRTVLGWYSRQTRPDGLLRKLPWWPFVDWGKDFESGVPPQDEDGGSAPITLQYVEALRYAADLESAYGEPHFAQQDREAAARASAAVFELCWNQQYGLLADAPSQKHYSQHANVLGVWLDVIPGDRQKDVLNKILSTTDPEFTVPGPVPPMTAATYYFRFYLARAIEHAGMGDRYLELLGPWKTMLALGLSTWAESPEPTRSDSHAWSAHPNYDLLTIVAGIHCTSPGFKTVSIEPHLGHLKHVKASIRTPAGVISVDYKRTDDTLAAELTLPAGTRAEFVCRGRPIAVRGQQKLTCAADQ
jgi:hypothetical protein